LVLESVPFLSSQKDTNIEGREVTRKLDDLIADDEENTAAGTAAFQSRNDIQNR